MYPGSARSIFVFALICLISSVFWAPAVFAENSFDSSDKDERYFLSRLGDIAPGAGGGKTVTPDERRLILYNIHTKERIEATFWANGDYDEGGLARLNHFLRDWRNDQVIEIDRTLLTLLFYIKLALQQDYPHIKNRPIEVISGYRSPESNTRLKKMGRNVSTNSRHMHGMAIDVRFPGVPVTAKRDVARKFNIGGVGTYHHNQFIHIDTGRVRYW